MDEADLMAWTACVVCGWIGNVHKLTARGPRGVWVEAGPLCLLCRNDQRAAWRAEGMTQVRVPG